MAFFESSTAANSNNGTFLNNSETNLLSRLNQLDYIIPVCLNLVLIILTLWSMVALCFYGKKAGMWKNGLAKKRDLLGVGMVYTSVIICTVACLSYLITTQAYMNIGYSEDEDEICNIIGDVANFTYGFVLLSVYIFLWTRQRVFYKNKMLNVKYGKGVKFFSSASIVVIVLAGISVMVFLMLPYNHKSSNDGCLYHPNDDLRTGYWISVFVVGAFGQTTLLGLLVYALKLSRGEKWKEDSSCILCKIFGDIFSTLDDSSTTDSEEENNVQRIRIYSNKSVSGKFSRSTRLQQKQSKNVRKILYKTVLFAILSTSCDLVFQIYVHYGASSNHNRRIDSAIGSVCAYLNLLFRVLSFANYKKMLMPYCRKI